MLVRSNPVPASLWCRRRHRLRFMHRCHRHRHCPPATSSSQSTPLSTWHDATAFISDNRRRFRYRHWLQGLYLVGGGVRVELCINFDVIRVLKLKIVENAQCTRCTIVRQSGLLRVCVPRQHVHDHDCEAVAHM